ncbi:hypothetical protein GS4_22_00360 [Gordonia soli NBRC 108243]|uniref:Pyridoxamine 5'-phosphate oxidase N-terminal domain-containing protein n=1 Tax=Gordonia soli NBRC 108243 TaxID=1223545 RepID=M0QL98_9ACTN|nr:hypothetical protein GS4_22_00360 [Gordonia soli NBRC 108243]
MVITEREWAAARSVTRRSVRGALHCSIASTNADGSPHVTPIGSLMLGSVGCAIYFDVFNVRLAENVESRPEVAVLAVDSGRSLWLPALVRGEFARPPGIRLVGTVGGRRPSTAEEVARFHRVVGPLLRTRGGATLWRSLPVVRDVTVESIDHLRMGSLTPGVRT